MNKFAFVAYDDFAIWQVALLQKFLKDKSWKMETFRLMVQTYRQMEE
ncbi:hypothetical protein ABES25_11555 [Bacillus gobiensis]